MNNKNSISKPLIITLCGVCIAANVVLSILIQFTKLPIFLDTIGTMLSGVMLGPLYGFLVGSLTNVISSVLLGSVKDIPFFLVNAFVGVSFGFIARRFGYSIFIAIVTGIVIAMICPIIGTPIAVYLYGGITGSSTDIFVTILKNSGHDIFSSTFIPRLFENIPDKIVSALLVYFIMKSFPKRYIQNTTLK